MNFKKLAAAILSTSMMMTAVTSMRISNFTANADYNTYESWGAAYRNTLFEFKWKEEFDNYSARFELYDINSDGIPELFISSGEYHTAELYIYTFLNGKVKELDNGGVVGTYGVANVVPSKSYIYFTGGGQGSFWTQVYEFNGKELNEVANLSDTSAAISADYKGYKFNDKKITKAQYDLYVSQYTSGGIENIGRDQAFDNLYNLLEIFFTQIILSI